MLLARSAPEGEADEIYAIADIVGGAPGKSGGSLASPVGTAMTESPVSPQAVDFFNRIDVDVERNRDLSGKSGVNLRPGIYRLQDIAGLFAFV